VTRNAFDRAFLALAFVIYLVGIAVAMFSASRAV